MIARDKLLHLGVGFILAVLPLLFAMYSGWLEEGGSLVKVLLAMLIAAELPTIAGGVKEQWDRRRPQSHTFDGWDAYATSVGGAIGMAFGVVVILFL